MGAFSSKKVDVSHGSDLPLAGLSPFLLNQELQYLLFTKYFTVNELLCCRQVSREWKATIEPFLPRVTVDLKFNAFADRIDVECKQLRITTFPTNYAVVWPPNVRVRSIKWHSYNDDCKRSNLKRLVQVLKLPNCGELEDLQLGMIESQIPREIFLPNLSLKSLLTYTIAIRKNWVKRPLAVLEEAESALRRLRKLKRFDISYNGDHDRLFELINVNPGIEEFSLQSDNFTSEEIVNFIRSLPAEHSSRTVSLSYVNDDQYEQVLQQLSDRSMKVQLEKSDVYELSIKIN